MNKYRDNNTQKHIKENIKNRNGSKYYVVMLLVNHSPTSKRK